MITAMQARAELLRRKAQTDLLACMAYCWWMPGPLHVGRHTRGICDRLTRAVEDFRRGISSYIVITLPFRHGKSDIASKALPAYFLGRCRDMQPNVMQSGYGTSLMKGFSQSVQQIISSEAYQRVFPGVAIDPSKSATDEWKLKDSVSTVYAQGLGAAITGRGANLIVLDDYCKNSEEAESEGEREKMWRSFRVDLLTRTNAPAHIVIVCATRWHVDDVIGRIKREMHENDDFPRFEFLEYPAHKDGEDGWEILFPEHYDADWYRKQRAQLGPYAAAALLDCDPFLAGATVFRREWLEFYAGELDTRSMRLIILVDGAKSKKATSDLTSVQVWGKNRDGRSYLLDGVHARLNLAEKIAEIFRLVERWGGSRRIDCVWWEQVGPMSDVEALRMEMDRRLYHFTVRELKHTSDKDFRMKRLVVPMSKGELVLPVRLIRTRIIEDRGVATPQAYDFVNELVEDEIVPYTGRQDSLKHDDQLDCMSDLMDDEILKTFTPPEGGTARQGGGTESYGSGRGLFGR